MAAQPLPQPAQDRSVAAWAKITKAREFVLLKHPFFANLILRQRLIETHEVETMATTGKELYFNPEFVLECSGPELHFVLAHEALHPALNHHTRRGTRHPEDWNEACDYVINPILIESRVGIMPEDGLYRRDLVVLTAEKAYVIIHQENQEERRQKQQQSQRGGEDGDKDESQSAGDEQGSGAGDAEGGDQPGQGQGGKGQGGKGQGGKGQGGKIPSYGGCGSIIDYQGTDAERRDEERDWNQAVIQASMAVGAGNLPGQLRRMVQEAKSPRADYRQILNEFVEQRARQDFTWDRPNRRFIDGGLYLPSLHSEQLPPILFIGDASGSMPQDAWNQSLSDVDFILQSLNPERVDVLIHDTEIIGEIHSFEPGDTVDVKAVAGGGTHFAPVCDWIQEHGEEYAVIIWFTDLAPGDWGRCTPPEQPLIWIDYAGGRWMAPDDVPFGDAVVHLDVDQ